MGLNNFAIGKGGVFMQKKCKFCGCAIPEDRYTRKSPLGWKHEECCIERAVLEMKQYKTYKIKNRDGSFSEVIVMPVI